MRRRTNPASTDLYDQAHAQWEKEYDQNIHSKVPVQNRSGIPIQPLYGPTRDSAENYLEALGFPGQVPYTRGIYTTMHRGKTWSQRQLIGQGTPDEYNKRVLQLIDAGTTAISLIPCNSVYRGNDCDDVPLPLLGTCGTVINTADHMDSALKGVDIGSISTAMNDPSPFTLLSFVLNTADRRSISWQHISGTSNQSDFLSHFVANHMFFRLSLEGARRILVDHIAFCRQRIPHWNPLSVVGQHMQQAGATPAQAMGFTLSSALQYGRDCLEHGMDPDDFLPRFTFFFDISMSLFEEVAKFRAGRRIWANLTQNELGAKTAHARRFKFHGQTSGADLTRQQPLNNITRVSTQAIAGILGGLQSLHTDAYDEVSNVPNEHPARIAVATQNILREEAGLCDVIDPLGGSWYVEDLTDQMEKKILNVMAVVENEGGMFKAVESGLVQRIIGESALNWQSRVDSGEQKIIGVNCYRTPPAEDQQTVTPTVRPAAEKMRAQVEQLRRFKNERSQADVKRTLAELSRAANSKNDNVFSKVVEATAAGVTHGEVVGCLRQELGFGHPLIVD
ncbi:MAG TPA: methylmalonyl-CoA mutase [Gammaproteobacteria bacterium]|jgi:methylmalonyl-CoA mutase N-terminal domain/subunit|nr:acyl-CoA mutase large subunit family protein [Gammaproteobacteria bacterium]RTZ61794.1 MAG: methylmalonyl-CoA mutase [Gammaproteobacteria bacterium]HAD38130.1 methylmalonyl-CoA mutase [Gammaproteobacteria bacterium]HBK77799.1 methylmalonyl-CoA mutase [Gammaproteobacteria bacterium]HHZ71604.1 methylmalonyl-CoA mutase [Gammaproteobacteria bacterium]